MNHVEILDEKSITKIISDFSNWEVKTNSPYIRFIGRNNGVTVTVYKNNKVMWQGSNINRNRNNYSTKPKKSKSLNSLSAIGSDEVGVGDYFGPLVVCAAFVNKNQITELIDLGVKDSKLLKDDQIKKIAVILIEKIEFSVALMDNKEYNNLISDNWNSHELKTFLHIRAINQLMKKDLKQQIIIVDKYSTIKMFKKYVERIELEKKIEFKPESLMFVEKAESVHIAVAAASIIARFYFLNAMAQIGEILKVKIPLGASKHVDRIATEIKTENGLSTLKKYVKWHFANSKRI